MAGSFGQKEGEVLLKTLLSPKAWRLLRRGGIVAVNNADRAAAGIAALTGGNLFLVGAETFKNVSWAGAAWEGLKSIVSKALVRAGVSKALDKMFRPEVVNLRQKLKRPTAKKLALILAAGVTVGAACYYFGPFALTVFASGGDVVKTIEPHVITMWDQVVALGNQAIAWCSSLFSWGPATA